MERRPGVSTARGVLVHIPSTLRSFTGGRGEVTLEAQNLADLLVALDRAHPGIGDRIADETGSLRRYVNIFVNGELIRASPREVPLGSTDEVHILPSIAGGYLGT